MSKSTLSAAALTFAVCVAHAAVAPEESAKLGATLTVFGAEKAGNKEGTIPEYTGGLTQPPANYQKGSGIRPDPFSGEKPKLSVDANSMAQNADKLTEGTKALLKKYPSYRLDIYPTHRTVAYPKYVLDNTLKCATTAKTSNGGQSLEGCHAGIPFAIPKDGNEAMWNHLTRFTSTAVDYGYKGLYVDSSGKTILATVGKMNISYPYWDAGKTSSETFYRAQTRYSEPARRAGEAIMFHDPLKLEEGRRAWTYLPGQRRIRLAPSIAFDTPNPSSGGASTYDEVYLFTGSMERFNFKLVGKKEIYVPYNAYEMSYGSKTENLVQPKHLNPDVVRWELHRVWVVEATLREGKRHLYSKRVFYLDEDSWVALASDEYDMSGQLYRAGFAYLAPSYEVPAPTAELHGHYDLVSGTYSLNVYTAELGGVRFSNPLPESAWVPDALAGGGVR